MNESSKRFQQPKTVLLAESAIFAAVYAAITMSLGYLGYGIIQVRISDAMIPLSALFGWPMIIGVTLGAFVANFYSFILFPGPTAILDIMFGPIANLIAAFITYQLRKYPEVGVVLATLIITGIVGTYLPFITFEPHFIAYLTVLIGSVISIALVGYFLLFALKRANLPPQFIIREATP